MQKMFSIVAKPLESRKVVSRIARSLRKQKLACSSWVFGDVHCLFVPAVYHERRAHGVTKVTQIDGCCWFVAGVVGLRECQKLPTYILSSYY